VIDQLKCSTTISRREPEIRLRVQQAPNCLSHLGSAMSDSGLQFSRLRIPVRFCPRASYLDYNPAGPYRLCTRCLRLKEVRVMEKKQATYTHQLYEVDQQCRKCGSMMWELCLPGEKLPNIRQISDATSCFRCSSALSKLGLAAGQNYAHLVIVTFAGDLQSP